MRRGLLLAAFFATLVLDMGGGFVFIVYAALNLNKNASFPAATWLLVRGVFNCIQFITVMALCYLVNRIKRLYSHKEEHMVVGNLLATHPVAFFYYCVILGGVVWNSLGSGWITTAFRDYNKAFGICYLVCIVLSWISVVLSPTFVFCGGLVYSRKRAIEPPQENGGLLDSILQEEEVMFDIKKVLAEFQREGVSLSVDDILWRDQFSQKEATDKPEFKPLGEDVTPVIVTNIVTNHEDSNSFVDNSILEDLTKELTLQRDDSERDGIVRIASDVLDDEFVNHQQEDAFVREMIQKQQAVIVEEDVGVASSLSGVAGSVTTPPLPIPTELPLQVTPSTSVESSSLGSPIVPNPTPLRNASPPPTESQPPRPKPKKFSKKKQPKECVVSVDSILSSSRTTNLPIIQTLPEDSNYSNEYVDLSQQMIQQINDGAFEKKGVNENVNVTYVSLSVFYNTLQIVLSSQTNQSYSQSFGTLIFIFLLLSNAEFSLRNVDTIKELTDILVSNENRLVDLSS